ncbi:MAG: hypothetical protein WBG57_09980, partial [Ornithinimicrobium sp.]
MTDQRTPSRLSVRVPGKRAVEAAMPLAMLASLLAFTPSAAAVAPDSSVFINELHYDNASTDTGEFIEVAGAAGTDLTGWSVVLYNGSNNTQYDSDPLSGTLGDDTGTGFGFATISYPTNGIQNGAPDGVALLDASGGVVQFLSYEGAFSTAAGQSTDIGVSESGNDVAGLSLQLTGTGDSYGDFVWASPAAQTPGDVNNDQVFLASGDPVPPTVDCEPSIEATAGAGATSPVSATDTDSGIDALAITSDAVDGITLEGSTAPTDLGTAATATLTVAGRTAVGTYQVEITATSDVGAQAVCTIAVTVSEPLETILISSVQGSGTASPLQGQEIQVEAVVTSLITDDDVLAGFYVQEEGADVDGDPA